MATTGYTSVKFDNRITVNDCSAQEMPFDAPACALERILMYIEIRKVVENELIPALFADFIRHIVVVKCRRKTDDGWTVVDDPFVDDWSEEEYQFLVQCLTNTIRTGGVVLGAFCNGVLKGFASVEAEMFGGENRYLDLTSLHVSEDMRGLGIGSRLFEAAKAWAADHGALKLHISSHSAIETQVFYARMGCVEAVEYRQAHVEAEPFDCQLECPL